MHRTPRLRLASVEEELRQIQRYYEERSPGLGSRFIDEFERQVLAFGGDSREMDGGHWGHSEVLDEAVSLHRIFQVRGS